MSDDAHDHEDHAEEHPGARDDEALSYRAKRVLAVQELLKEKGVIGEGEVRSRVDVVKARSPANGARVVARAWVDAEFKGRLLSEPRATVNGMGYDLPADSELAIVEDTEELHHLVVCTLCSCYPHGLLGPPPDWYKSLAYRSRAVVEPRKVMSEFGLEVEDDVEVRVMDSTADMRYLVLPLRPEGTEGLTEEELASLVTRDSMIGVGRPLT